MHNLWLFKEKRLVILRELLRCDSSRGCDLGRRLKVEKNLLSYHLAVLREKGIIEEAKEGREKHYRIKRTKMPLVRSVLKVVG